MILKRLLNISLLFFYLTAVIGINISLHYCGGSLASINLIEKASCCCDDNETTDDGCCKDDFKQFKIHDDQLESNKIQNKYEGQGDFYSQTYFKFTFSQDKLHAQALNDKLPLQPPQRQPVKIYQLTHAYLYYS